MKQNINTHKIILIYTNISLALLRHGNLLKRRKLLLYATFSFSKAVLVQ